MNPYQNQNMGFNQNQNMGYNNQNQNMMMNNNNNMMMNNNMGMSNNMGMMNNNMGMMNNNMGMMNQNMGMMNQNMGMKVNMNMGMGMNMGMKKKNKGFGKQKMKMKMGYNQKQMKQVIGGTVQLIIGGAKGLKAADMNGKSDPYCQIKVAKLVKNKKDKSKHSGSKKKKKNKAIYKTSTKKKTLNPVWNEGLNVTIGDVNKEYIQILIYDYDTLSEDDIIGHVSIPVNYLPYGYKIPYTLKVHPKGTLSFTVQALNFGYPQQNYQWCIQQTNQQMANLSTITVKRVKNKRAKKMKKMGKKIGKKLGKGLMNLLK